MSSGNGYKLFVSTDGTSKKLKEIKAVNLENYDEQVGYTLPYSGYITFELEEPIEVEGKFLVAMEVISKEVGEYIIPAEINNGEICDNVESEKNIGYIASSIEALKKGVRYDIANEKGNLCLKAFTKN